MKRNIIMVLLFALAMGGSLLAEEGTTFKVKTPSANVRSKPDSAAPIIAKVTAGTVLKVYGKEGVWYEVGVNDQAGKEVYGFVHSTMGEVSREEAEETEASPPAAARDKMIIKVKVQTANVRSKPDASAPIIAKVVAGDLLEPSGKNGSFYEVTVNDQSGKEVTGYIHSSVVEVIAADEKKAEAKPRAAVRREMPRAHAAKEFAGSGIKVMAGLAMSNVNVSQTIPAEAKKTSKMGFMGGLGYESGGRMAFEMDLLYSPGGAVIKATDPAVKSKLSISGTGIALPIMLKVRFLPGTTPYVLAGGEIGYILNQKVVVTAADGTSSETDVTDNINRLFYGLVFGGGVELQAGNMNLFFEARYRLGLSNQVKDPDPGEYVKATALMFLLGVKF